MTPNSSSPASPVASLEGLVVTYLLVCDDVAAATRFYCDILGGTVVRSAGPGPILVRLANAYISLAVGGDPTPDKPTVNLAPPADLERVASFLNLRVADIDMTYREWSRRGAQFLTAPLDNHGVELRCYLRDPSGHLIEVGQALDQAETAQTR